MANPYIGEIKLFAGTYAPQGWAFCDGSLLSISQNSVLFAVIGTMYGGDGQTTFALPDMRSRVPVHAGQSAGGSSYKQGQQAGTENVTLTTAQLPAHNHAQMASSSTQAGQTDPTQAVHGSSDGISVYSTGANAQMSPQSIAAAGGSLPHNNIQPVLAVNYIIALVGLFPPHS